MEKKTVLLSNLETAIEETVVENDWVDVSNLHVNDPSKEPTTTTTTGDAILLANNIIKCKVCHVNFSDSVPYEQHMNSSKHKKNVRKESMKQKYGPKYLEVLNSQETESEPTVKTVESASDDDIVVIKCDVCSKICTGLTSYTLHITGKSHQKQLRKQRCIEKLQENSGSDNRGKELQNSIYNITDQVKPFAQCDVCNKKFSGPENLQDHLSSTLHRRKQDMQKLTEELIGGTTQPVNDGSQEVFAQCQTCEKSFSGPVPYQQHLISEAHQKKLKMLELAEKMKSLSMNNGGEDIFHCKECERSFCIPKEFEQHLNSNSHTKRKARQQMIEKLQKEYPEAKVQLATANHDHSSENKAQPLDDNIIITCTVCHNSFSGPESANAHFSSQRHAKSMKQQLLFLQRKEELKDTF